MTLEETELGKKIINLVTNGSNRSLKRLLEDSQVNLKTKTHIAQRP